MWGHIPWLKLQNVTSICIEYSGTSMIGPLSQMSKIKHTLRAFLFSLKLIVWMYAL